MVVEPTSARHRALIIHLNRLESPSPILIRGGDGGELDRNHMPDLDQHHGVVGIHIAQLHPHLLVRLRGLMINRAILMANSRPSSGVAVISELFGTSMVCPYKT